VQRRQHNNVAPPRQAREQVYAAIGTPTRQRELRYITGREGGGL
jgi:hypothetical protein